MILSLLLLLIAVLPSSYYDLHRNINGILLAKTKNTMGGDRSTNIMEKFSLSVRQAGTIENLYGLFIYYDV